MSVIEQGTAVVKKVSEIIGGLTRARGAAGRAADERTRITSDVSDVKSAGQEVAEGLSNLKSAGSKLDSDVKATAANVSADVAAVNGVRTPAGTKASESKPAPKTDSPKAAAPKPAPSAPKKDAAPKA